MKEEDKTTENMAAPNPADQKSDESPEELMGQVSSADESLDSGPRVSSVDAMANESTSESEARPTKVKPKGIKGLLARINIYFLLFILVLVVAAAAFGVTYTMNKREQEIRLTTSELTESDIAELKTTDAIVGDPKQILTIESNAVITGKVVMRDSLDVAGALRIGGPLSLPSIRAGGEGNFGSLQTNDFQAAGNAAVGGILDIVGTVTMGQNLTVKGTGNFGGRVDIGGPATINGNLNVNGTISATGLNFGNIAFSQINTNGAQPGITVSGAAGGGSTASISGTDTSGIATINTGGSTGTGILATITFSSAFSGTARPVLTPNGPGCANIAYYVTNMSATQFSIASATAPPAGATCRFNFIVVN
jgi:hypothetical protein